MKLAWAGPHITLEKNSQDHSLAVMVTLGLMCGRAEMALIQYYVSLPGEYQQKVLAQNSVEYLGMAFRCFE